MVQDLQQHDSDKKHVLLALFIEPISVLDDELSKFKELVETTVDLEMAGRGEYFVRPDFDPALEGNNITITWTQYLFIYYFQFLCTRM